MKFKYILLIVLVIIALHLVVVWFFMRGGNVPAAGAEAALGDELLQPLHPGRALLLGLIRGGRRRGDILLVHGSSPF